MLFVLRASSAGSPGAGGSCPHAEHHPHLLYFSFRAAALYCRGCGRRITRDTPEGIFALLRQHAGAAEPRLIITFPVRVPESFTVDEIKDLLARQGYIRIQLPNLWKKICRIWLILVIKSIK